jgi:alkanesulfonate monooxygenase SsuD/methylene tetrahydromethanopterin reductase-like flavin-dependent oxidoreductase (luciferase family)
MPRDKIMPLADLPTAQREVNQAAEEFERLKSVAKQNGYFAERLDSYRGLQIIVPEIEDEADYVFTLKVKRKSGRVDIHCGSGHSVPRINLHVSDARPGFQGDDPIEQV